MPFEITATSPRANELEVDQTLVSSIATAKLDMQAIP